MSAGPVVLIVVIVVLVAAAATAAGIRLRRRAAARSLVGPEYDRLARDVGQRQARAEFGRRRQRVDKLGIRSLDGERRSGYAGQWDAAQQRFIDSPAEAVSAAAALVTAVAVDRGYEAGDHDRLMTDLSVYHGRHLDAYRHARSTTERAGEATTEALRLALLDYRRLFLDLLESPGYGGHGGLAAAVPGGRHDRERRERRRWARNPASKPTVLGCTTKDRPSRPVSGAR